MRHSTPGPEATLQTEVIGDLEATALAAGFDPALGEHELSLLACVVLDDSWLMRLVNENCEYDDAAPGPHTHPDLILLATLASLSDSEKAGLRARTVRRKNVVTQLGYVEQR